MSKTKFLTSILLAMAVLFAQVGIVAAAPPAQDTTPPTITEITTETDENGVTTVLVTLEVEGEAPQTVRLSLEYALELGLIDPTTQEPVLLENVPPDTTVDPTRVIEVVPVEEPTEPDVHPISMLLANFFFGAEDDLTLTYEMASAIDSFHNGDYENGEGETLDQVFGFGVIAQALWMAKDSEGTDIELAGDILQFKRDKDYDAFLTAHPEYEDQFGDEIPANWGQFKKVLKEKKNNLGVIVSGQAEEDGTQDPALQQNSDQQNQGNDKHDKQDKQKKQKKQKKH